MDPSALPVAHALRIKGFASDDAVVEATRLPAPDVSVALRRLAEEGLAAYREGRLCGWMLTPAGRTVHASALRDEIAALGCASAIEAGYDAFIPLNEDFKQICTDWQLRPAGVELVPNDHADVAYDAGVIDRVAALHAAFSPIPNDLGRALARFAAYAPRFQTAADRVASGDRNAIARPLSGSYHDVWMEFHQDLLLTLGRERTENDGS